MQPLYLASKSRECEEAMHGRSGYSVRLGAMRRSSPTVNGRGNILMYSTPRIIASLDAAVVLAEALGDQVCSQQHWCK